MLCGKCGSAMEDGALFCPNCGEPAAIEAEPAIPADQPVAEAAPEYQEPVNEAYIPAEEEAVPYDADSEYPSMSLNTEGETPAPKKIGKLPFLIGGIVAAVAAILLVVFNFSSIAGFFVRSFSSGEKLQSKVYQDAVSQAFDELDSAGSEAVDLSNVGYEGEIRLSLDEKLLNMIPTEGVDISWLSELAIGYDISVKDELGKIGYDLILGQTSIVGAEQIINTETMEQWISIPELNDMAMYINAMDNMDTEQMQALAEVMPSQETVEKILLRYVDIFMSGFGDVEKSSDTVKIGGVSQKLYLLEATMDEDDLVEVAKDLLKALKKDEDIEQIIRNMEEYTGEEGLYDSFIESIDESLENAPTDDDELDSFKITVTTYLNGSNDIVGLKLKVSADGEKMEPFYWVTVQKGNKFATEIVISADGEEILIEGEGENGKTTNGEYVVSYNDEEFVTVKISDYVADEKQISGTIRITPAEALMEQLLSEAGMDGSVAGIALEMVEALEIELSGNQQDGKVAISIVGGGTKYITVSVSAKQTEADAITVPENYVDMNDYDAQDEWVSNMDFGFIETLMERLIEAGVPEEFFEAGVSGVM